MLIVVISRSLMHGIVLLLKSLLTELLKIDSMNGNRKNGKHISQKKKKGKKERGWTNYKRNNKRNNHVAKKLNSSPT